MSIKCFKMIRTVFKNWRRFFKLSSLSSALIFILYVCMFIFHGILITATQTADKKYLYSTTTVVLGTELLKLTISLVLYGIYHPIRNLFRDIRKDVGVLALYLVPALLYCLYNNLAYVNLAHFDPTSYYLLLQFRVAITGILFQAIFKKWLSKMQWFSLVLLTCGCLLKQVEFDWNRAPNVEMDKFLNPRLLFVILQVCCSCCAGVYNEYLLKSRESTTDIYVQNIFMYLDSIAFNFLALFLVDKHPLAAFSADSLSNLCDFRILLIMVNSAAVGIITSFFLKKFNSILKVFAGALELICSAIISYLLFNIPAHANTILAILIVCSAMALYTFYPVNNNPGNVAQNKRPGAHEPAPESNTVSRNAAVLDLELQNTLTIAPVNMNFD